MENDLFQSNSLFYDSDASDEERVDGLIGDLIERKRGKTSHFEYYGITRVMDKLHSNVGMKMTAQPSRFSSISSTTTSFTSSTELPCVVARESTTFFSTTTTSLF